MKTSELIGTTLDWAVAKCEEKTVISSLKRREAKNDDYILFADCIHRNGNSFDVYSPSTDWSQGGPIIEQEGIGFHRNGKRTFSNESRRYESHLIHNQDEVPTLRVGFRGTGPTPLIAACRCYVSSKLGDEVEIPEELL